MRRCEKRARLPGEDSSASASHETDAESEPTRRADVFARNGSCSARSYRRRHRPTCASRLVGHDAAERAPCAV